MCTHVAADAMTKHSLVTASAMAPVKHQETLSLEKFVFILLHNFAHASVKESKVSTYKAI